jgi:transcription factor SPT20 homolog
VTRDNLNTIVLNLYSTQHNSNGYTLGFNIKSSDNNNKYKELNETETKLLSYDENELFYYINCGEIPPIIIDLVDRLKVTIFYDGCIIIEVRDYRRFNFETNGIKQEEEEEEVNLSKNMKYDSHHVLLKPSIQTLICDVNNITNDSHHIWTQEDKYNLESQLLLATSQPLCLSPDPIVSIIKNKLLFHKYKMNDRKLKK